MTKILFIAGIVFYLIHRYLLKKEQIKYSVEFQKQADIRNASIELQREKDAVELQMLLEANEIQKQKKALELQKRKEAEELQRQKDNEIIELQKQKAAIEFAENILDRIKKQGGLDYSYESPYYDYNKKLSDFMDKIRNNNLENNLINAGRQDLITQIKYGFKYLYLCPDCKTVTDVKRTELNHGHDEKEYLSNGRYTKDGSLDERYHTEFRTIHTYYFDAVCDHCGSTFKVDLDENDFKTRNEL